MPSKTYSRTDKQFQYSRSNSEENVRNSRQRIYSRILTFHAKPPSKISPASYVPIARVWTTIDRISTLKNRLPKKKKNQIRAIFQTKTTSPPQFPIRGQQQLGISSKSHRSLEHYRIRQLLRDVREGGDLRLGQLVHVDVRQRLVLLLSVDHRAHCKTRLIHAHSHIVDIPSATTITWSDRKAMRTGETTVG